MTDYLKKFSLSGKTSFVLGGLGLIGKEVSIAYAQAGARIIVLDIIESEGIFFEDQMMKKGYNITFETFDCSDVDNISENFEKILKKHTVPDIFTNCSYPHTKNWGKSSLKDITLNSFRENVDIHMNSYSWLAHLAAKSMVDAKKEGSVIQLGSTYGIVGQDLTVYEGTDMEENMTYSAIKGGITNLTRQLASYYGQFNIRINTLCPGGLEGHVAGKSRKQNEVFDRQYCNRIPLKRMGCADEIASTALFLASDASSYITGATIMADGGWTSI